MAKFYRTCLFYFHYDVGNLVAFAAIFDVKGPFPIMAGAAGFTLFHIGHGVAGLFPEVENRIVADFTVIFDAFLLKVKVVIEYDPAEFGNLEGDILDVNCMGKRKGKKSEDEDREGITKLHEDLLKKSQKKEPYRLNEFKLKGHYKKLPEISQFEFSLKI